MFYLKAHRVETFLLFPQHVLTTCADWCCACFRAQKKTTTVSLTIRSSSPKTLEVLPHRSTLVQSLSQPPPRVSTYLSAKARRLVNSEKKSLSEWTSHGQIVMVCCVPDAEPSVFTLRRWGVRPSFIYEGKAVCNVLVGILVQFRHLCCFLSLAGQ